MGSLIRHAEFSNPFNAVVVFSNCVKSGGGAFLSPSLNPYTGHPKLIWWNWWNMKGSLYSPKYLGISNAPAHSLILCSGRQRHIWAWDCRCRPPQYPSRSLSKRWLASLQITRITCSVLCLNQWSRHDFSCIITGKNKTGQKQIRTGHVERVPYMSVFCPVLFSACSRVRYQRVN